MSDLPVLDDSHLTPRQRRALGGEVEDPPEGGDPRRRMEMELARMRESAAAAPAPDLNELAKRGYSFGEQTSMSQVARAFRGLPENRHATIEEGLRSGLEEIKAYIAQRDREFLATVQNQGAMQAMGAMDAEGRRNEELQMMLLEMGESMPAGARVPELMGQASEDLASVSQMSDLPPEILEGIRSTQQRQRQVSSTGGMFNQFEEAAREAARNLGQGYKDRGWIEQAARGFAGELGAGEMGPQMPLGSPSYLGAGREHLERFMQGYLDLLEGKDKQQQAGPFEPGRWDESYGLSGGYAPGGAPRATGDVMRRLQDAPNRRMYADVAGSYSREELEPHLRKILRKAVEEELVPQIEGVGEGWFSGKSIGELAGMLAPIHGISQAGAWTGKMGVGVLRKLGVLAEAGLGGASRAGVQSLARKSIAELGEQVGMKGFGRLFVHGGMPAAALGAYALSKDPPLEVVQEIDDRIAQGQLDPQNREAAVKAARAMEGIRWAAFYPLYAAAGAAGDKLGRLVARRLGSSAAAEMGGGAVGGALQAALFPLAGHTGEEMLNGIRLMGEDQQNWLGKQIELGIIARGNSEGATPTGQFVQAMAAGDGEAMREAISAYLVEVSHGVGVFGFLGMRRAARELNYEEALWQTGEELAQFRQEARKTIEKMVTDPVERKELLRLVEDEIRATQPSKRGASMPFGKFERKLSDRLAENPEIGISPAEVKATERTPGKPENDRPRSVKEELQRVREERSAIDPKDRDAREFREEMWADEQYLRFKEQELLFAAGERTQRHVAARTRSEAWRDYGLALREWREGGFAGKSPSRPDAARYDEIERQAGVRQLYDDLGAGRTARSAAERVKKYRQGPQMDLDRVNTMLRRFTDRIRAAEEQATTDESREKRVGKVQDDIGILMERELKPGTVIRYPSGREMVVITADAQERGRDFRLLVAPLIAPERIEPGRRGRETAIPSEVEMPMQYLSPRDFGPLQEGMGLDVMRHNEQIPEWARQQAASNITLRLTGQRRYEDALQDLQNAPDLQSQLDAGQEVRRAEKPIREQVKAIEAKALEVKQQAEVPAEGKTEQDARPAGPLTGNPVRDARIAKTVKEEGVSSSAAEIAADRKAAGDKPAAPVLSDKLLSWAKTEEERAAAREASEPNPNATPRPTDPAFHPEAQAKIQEAVQRMEDLQARISQPTRDAVAALPQRGRKEALATLLSADAEVERVVSPQLKRIQELDERLKDVPDIDKELANDESGKDLQSRGELQLGFKKRGRASEDRVFLEIAAEKAGEFARLGSHRFAAEVLNVMLHRQLDLPDPTMRLGDMVSQMQREVRDLVDKVREDPSAYLRWIAGHPGLQGPASVAMRWYAPGVKLVKDIQGLAQIAKNAGLSMPEQMMWAFRGSAGAGLFRVPDHAMQFASWMAGLASGRMRHYDAFTREYFVPPFSEEVHRGPIRGTIGRAVRTPVVGEHFRTPADFGGEVAFDGIRMQQEAHTDAQMIMTRFFHKDRGIFRGIKKDSPEDYLASRLVRDRKNTSGEWDSAPENVKEAARRMIEYLDQDRAQFVEASGPMLSLRRHSDALRRELTMHREDTRRLKTELGESQAFAKENPQLGEWSQRSEDLRKAVRKAQSKRRQDARKGKDVAELDEMIEASKAEIEVLDQNIDEMLVDAKVGEPGRVERSYTEARNAARLTRSKIAEAKKRMDELRRPPEEGGYGIPDYMRDIPYLEEDIKSYGTANQISLGLNTPTAPMPSRRKVSTTELKKDLEHGLAAQGKQDPSAQRALADYIRRSTEASHMNRFIARHHEKLFGVRGSVRSHEAREAGYIKGLLSPRTAADRKREYDYLGMPGLRSLGVHRRVMTENGVTFERGPGGSRELLLYRGAESVAFLRDPQKVKSALLNGNLVKVSPGRAARYVFTEAGGLFETLSWRRADTMESWWNRVLRTGKKMQGGELERVAKRMLRMQALFARVMGEGKLSKKAGELAAKTPGGLAAAARTAGFLVSTKVLGANPISASNAWFGASILNMGLLGPRRWAETMHLPLIFGKAFLRDEMSGDPFNDMGNVEATDALGRPQLMGDMAKRFRTPEAELAKMTPKKRAERKLYDDMIQDFYTSGVGSGTRGVGYWEALDPAGKQFTAGLIRKGWTKAMAAAWLPFESAEFLVRTQAYGAVYLDARRAGRSRDQAKALAAAGVMKLHGVFNPASKSAFFNSFLGPTLGGVLTWIFHAGGSFARLDTTRKAEVLATLLGTQHLGLMVGHDFTNVLGTPIHELPGLGRELEAALAGIGFATEDDPQGLEEKGLGSKLFPTGAWVPAMPLSYASPFVSIIEAGIDWASSVWHADGQADRKFGRFMRAALEPNIVNYIRRTGAYIPWDPKPAVGAYEEGKGYPYRPPFSEKTTEYLPETGGGQFLVDLIPGVTRSSSELWWGDRAGKARENVRKFAGERMNEKLKDAARRASDFLAIERAGGDATAERDMLKEDMRSLNEEGKLWGREYGGPELTRAMKDVQADERFDRRGQAIINAKTSRGQLEELILLLEDRDYTVTPDYARDLLRHLGGKQGVAAWMRGAANQRLAERFRGAWDARFSVVQQPVGR